SNDQLLTKKSFGFTSTIILIIKHIVTWSIQSKAEEVIAASRIIKKKHTAKKSKIQLSVIQKKLSILKLKRKFAETGGNLIIHSSTPIIYEVLIGINILEIEDIIVWVADFHIFASIPMHIYRS